MSKKEFAEEVFFQAIAEYLHNTIPEKYDQEG